MKEKKIFMGLALVIAVLALGVAYAAISTQTLNVAGNATAVASNENFNVVFEGTVTNTKSSTASNATVTASGSGKSGTFTISGLDTKGESVTLKFPIVNKSPDLGAALKNVQITNSDTNKAWWDVSATLSNTSLTANGGTATLDITVTLKDTPATDTEAPTGTFHVTFDADPT